MGRKYRNYQFKDSLMINDATFTLYLDIFKRLALSIFEWVNLPNSMDEIWLEKCLYYNGQAAFLKDKNYGFINTNCCSNGDINIYGLPTNLNCYSIGYQSSRKLYTGLIEGLSDLQKNQRDYYECILVQNNWERTPTAGSMELFALRIYEAERSSDVNIKAQKTPILLLVDEKQRLSIMQLYNQYNGNQPFIFGDKNNLGIDNMKAINTEAPFVADKLQEYKKEIFNEALTFLGINNIIIDKKERLITDEANSNNELINLNLQSFLAPRMRACKQFNEKFGFTGTKNEISVRVRSDLHNIIKSAQSIITDYKKVNDLQENLEGVKENGEIYNRTTQSV